MALGVVVELGSCHDGPQHDALGADVDAALPCQPLNPRNTPALKDKSKVPLDLCRTQSFRHLAYKR